MHWQRRIFVLQALQSKLPWLSHLLSDVNDEDSEPVDLATFVLMLEALQTLAVADHQQFRDSDEVYDQQPLSSPKIIAGCLGTIRFEWAEVCLKFTTPPPVVSIVDYAAATVFQFQWPRQRDEFRKIVKQKLEIYSPHHQVGQQV